MAIEILMPRQGNTVESCIIISWKKKEGDKVKEGEAICEVETDKATFDVEATEAGVLLKILFPEGEDVPVLTPIAIIGNEGEDIKEFLECKQEKKPDEISEIKKEDKDKKVDSAKIESVKIEKSDIEVKQGEHISPRAKNIAHKKGVDISQIRGSGPGGRIIERDVEGYLKGHEPLTPAAMDLKNTSGLNAPISGTGIGGRVLSTDLGVGNNFTEGDMVDSYEEIPVKGVRKVISEKMHYSLQNTAQLTLNASADATVILDYRKRLKEATNDEELNKISINDLILYAVTKTLSAYKEINAHFLNDKILMFNNVNLGFAVDTPKGLMVPVIKHAERLSLKGISKETKRLSSACNQGKILPDELKGATFTVTNLGALGIESFTPVLNPPEVCILGICSVQLKPIMNDNGVTFVPHIGLSLTFNHQAVDGAPAARFLRDISKAIANFNLLLID